jgi:hypothetical protein
MINQRSLTACFAKAEPLACIECMRLSATLLIDKSTLPPELLFCFISKAWLILSNRSIHSHRPIPAALVTS